MAGHIGDTVSVHWGTPKKYVERIKAVFGGSIDLDPCSNEHSSVDARWRYILPANDGLYTSWSIMPNGLYARNAYVNPPYGRTRMLDRRVLTKDEFKALDAESKKRVRTTTIADWLARCEEYGNPRHRAPEWGPYQVIALVPAAVDTQHWHQNVFKTASQVLFVEGRIAFDLPDGVPNAPAPNASAFVYWGPNVGRFNDVFHDLGFLMYQPKTVGVFDFSGLALSEAEIAAVGHSLKLGNGSPLGLVTG